MIPGKGKGRNTPHVSVAQENFFANEVKEAATVAKTLS
jgi:hypothetical protein